MHELTHTERRLRAIAPVVFIADGTINGLVTVSDVGDFKVKQEVLISAPLIQTQILEIKRIVSQTQLLVGPKGNIFKYSDISAFTVAAGSFIEAKEQERPKVPEQEVERITYEEEPTMARRVISVDRYGRKWDVDNPFPVRLSNGSINVGTVNAEIEVQLSRRDNYPDAGDVHDSVRIGNQDYELKINPDGSINTAGRDGASALDIRRDIVNNVIYMGMAAPGSLPSDAAWRITRTSYAYNNKTNLEDEVILLAGNGEFDQVWDNRASLFPAVTSVNFWDRKVERILPLLANAKWMANTSFDSITPDFSSDETAVFSYTRHNAIIARAFIKYNNDLDWQISLERYINQDDGNQLTLDNGSAFMADA